nr:putative capsid [Marmot picobirnavirus]
MANRQNQNQNGSTKDCNTKFPNSANGKRSAKSKRRKSTTQSQSSAKLDSTGRDNDPNWYFLSKDIADQASSFAFNQFIGTKPDQLTTIHRNGDAVSVSTPPYHVPTIMVLTVNPSPGYGNNIQSGINMAGLKTFTTLSSRNAKTTQYAPQDVTTLILALGEVISAVEFIRRAFGVAFTYNQRNRALPLALLGAMGINANDFLAHLADYRLQANALITQVNKIPFPANIGYLYKCADIYQNVYLDSDSAMAQIILMRPNSSWILNEAYSEQGTGLNTINYLASSGGAADMSAILEAVTSMVNAIMESATYNYIYADILNFVDKTGSKTFFLDYILEGYSVIPQFNANFLLQIHNAIAVGAPATAGKWNDVQPNVNKNCITYDPVFPWNDQDTKLQEVLVDMPMSNPSVVDRIEATRYSAVVKEYGAATGWVKYTLPDHYIVQFFIMFDDKSTVSGVPSAQSFMSLSKLKAAEQSYLCLKTQFNWSPLTYVYFDEANEMYISGELNYYTNLDAEWFERVTDLTFQALFDLRS